MRLIARIGASVTVKPKEQRRPRLRKRNQPLILKVKMSVSEDLENHHQAILSEDASLQAHIPSQDHDLELKYW